MRPRWIENLKELHRAQTLQCKKAFVPPNAVNPNEIKLLVCSDAAASMCGCAVYARFKLADGSYSCQLITARSKTSQGSIPRNELEGCSLAAQTAFTVAKALGPKVIDLFFATDSTISVCWISNPDNKLKQFVNARVKLIKRLVGDDRFYHVAGEKNPADLLTRGNVTCGDLEEDSRWHNGDPWMPKKFEEMPLTSYEKICSELTSKDKEVIEKESHPTIPATMKTFCTELGEQVVLHLPCHENQQSCSENKPLCCKCNGRETCCVCLYVANTTDAPKLKLVCLNLKGRVPKPQVNKIKIEESGGDLQKGRYLVDFVTFGFVKAFQHLVYVVRFALGLKHRIHIRKGIESKDSCPLCCVS